METFAMPLWAIIPFVLMLLSIAIGPIVAEHFWEKNWNKLLVAVVLSIPVAIYMAMVGMGHELVHTVFYDYLPFIILLLSLFVITGGIHMCGDIKATPAANSVILALGFVLASIMGTTGAAMLLIRPLLIINQQRQYRVHTILFFIAMVANCGGLMTPLGDPPLFMLFLRGASFTWFLGMWKPWLFTGAVLLGIYLVLDTIYYKREDWVHRSADAKEKTPIRITGKINFLYLLGVVASVAFLNEGTISAMGAEGASWVLKYLREIALVGLTLLSLVTTAHQIRYVDNKYTWTPILEVAALFIGIFVTMAPALIFLRQNAQVMGLTHVWQYYFSTGALSSFLDNTPTAVAFHSMATGLSPEVMTSMGGNLVAGIPSVLLEAISIGAVFFGSMTYIGNGPNFMVKAIAEENAIKMPSFFGYMIKFSLIILLPIYILVWLLFL